MRASVRTSRRWLSTARKDLNYARLAADAGFHAHACFNAHQSAEKAVKATHYAKGARMVLGRSIRQLIESLHVPSLAGVSSAARQLDLYYVPSRYPIDRVTERLKKHSLQISRLERSHLQATSLEQLPTSLMR